MSWPASFARQSGSKAMISPHWTDRQMQFEIDYRMEFSGRRHRTCKKQHSKAYSIYQSDLHQQYKDFKFKTVFLFFLFHGFRDTFSRPVIIARQPAFECYPDSFIDLFDQVKLQTFRQSFGQFRNILFIPERNDNVRY